MSAVHVGCNCPAGFGCNAKAQGRGVPTILRGYAFAEASSGDGGFGERTWTFPVDKGDELATRLEKLEAKYATLLARVALLQSAVNRQ